MTYFDPEISYRNPVVGINKIGNMAKEVAQLPNAANYTPLTNKRQTHVKRAF